MKKLQFQYYKYCDCQCRPLITLNNNRLNESITVYIWLFSAEAFDLLIKNEFLNKPNM